MSPSPTSSVSTSTSTMSGASSTSPLSQLPLELVYHTLRFASADSRRTALACACVSTDVRRATACELYHTVILQRPAQIEGFVNLLLSERNEGKIDVKTRIHPGSLVRTLVITHHVPTHSSTSSPPTSRPPSPAALQALRAEKDPYTIIFALCPHIRRAVLQASFLHSSLVSCDAVNRMRWLAGGELVVCGPVFPSDWEAHVDAIENFPSTVDFDEEEDEQILRIGLPGVSVLAHTTHLVLLESLSSPHISAYALARLPSLTHVALRVRAPHPHCIHANLPFADVLPLLTSSSIAMIVVIVDGAHTGTPQCRLRRAHTESELEDENLMREHKAKERLEHLAESARELDERVFVVERRAGMSGDVVKGWREEDEEDVWVRAVKERGERDTKKTCMAS